MPDSRTPSTNLNSLNQLTRDILGNYGGINRNSLFQISALNSLNLDDNEPIFDSISPYFDLDSLKSTSTADQLLNSFSILSLNIQSIHAKIEELRIFIQRLSDLKIHFDALCLQETWLDYNVDPSQFAIDGYRLILQAKSASMHGGLAIYLRTEYEHETYFSVNNSEFFESLFLKIKLDRCKHLLIGNIYRPPNNSVESLTTFFDELSQRLSRISDNNLECAIAGDFNIDLLKLHERTKTREYYDLLSLHGFLPKISFPTRLSETCATLIDNILCKLSSEYSHTTAGIFIEKLSDHQPCFLALDFLKQKSHRSDRLVTVATQPNNFPELVKNDLISINLNDMLIASDPNENFDILSGTLDNIMKKYTVIKTVKFNKYKHKHNPWMTQGILISIKNRDKLYRKLRKTSHESTEHARLKVNLSTYNRIIKNSIRVAKANYYQNAFDNANNDPRKTWRTINSVLNRSATDDSLPTSISFNGCEIQDKQLIVNSFNEHFASIGRKLSDSLDQNSNSSYEGFLTDSISSTFTFRPISRETVTKTIDNLPSKNSRAADGISSKFLKSIRDELAQPLTFIVNQTLESGIFPDKLKVARVRALFKKGDKSDVNNYRPISILPTLSKVFERIILKQMTEYFIENDLLFHGQYGFREKHSTELAAIELVDRISTAMDSGSIPFNIYIDLSKAFDCLNHSILLSKLNHYGVRGSALNLIRSYLQNRKQFVRNNDMESPLADLTTGIPQGSILGPFLFLIFMNDFHRSSNLFRMINYADDTTLISTVSAFHSDLPGRSIDDELRKISSWLTANKMCLNIGKTKIMFFHSKSKQFHPPAVSLNGITIESVDEFNYLGIIINKHLSWQPHVNSVCSKLSKICGILAKLKRLVPRNILITIYNSLMACHICYGILVWGKHAGRILKTQKRAVRIICDVNFNAHTDRLFKTLRILKVDHIRNLHELKFYFRFLDGSLPFYFKNDFINSNNVHHSYSTRHRDALMTPRFRHEFFRDTLRYCIVETINNCPNMIFDKLRTHSFHGFSNYVKNWHFSNYETTCQRPNCFVCR